MKTIIAGGGTGGHLFPAVALGEELKRERPDAEVLHVGASNGLEATWLPQSGLKYELFPVRGLRGKDPLTRLRAIGEFFAAVRRARALLKSFGADLVVSAGGYASAPMAVAAIIARRSAGPDGAKHPARDSRIGCSGDSRAKSASVSPIPRPSSTRHEVVVTGNPVRLRFIPEPLEKTSGSNSNPCFRRVERRSPT